MNFNGNWKLLVKDVIVQGGVFQSTDLAGEILPHIKASTSVQPREAQAPPPRNHLHTTNKPSSFLLPNSKWPPILISMGFVSPKSRPRKYLPPPPSPSPLRSPPYSQHPPLLEPQQGDRDPRKRKAKSSLRITRILRSGLRGIWRMMRMRGLGAG